MYQNLLVFICERKNNYHFANEDYKLTDLVTQQTHWNRSETLTDAAAHSEHGQLIRCDI
jgi:hypothetical protein